jgi:hypothetical protein
MATTTHRQQPAPMGLAGGLVAFGATILLISGVLDVFRGVVAVAKDNIVVNTPDYTFQFSTTGWGWIHIALGVAAILVGIGLYRGNIAAKVAGVFMAGLIILSSFLSLPYYPLWSLILLGLSGFVIWAICTVRQPRAG